MRSYAPPASATQRRQSAWTSVCGPARRLRLARGVRPHLAAGREAVGGEVPLGPGEVGRREVHGRGRRRSPGEGVHRHRAGVGEEVEEAAAAGELADQPPREPLVDEEAGVQVRAEVDEVGEVVLAHLEELALVAAALVLRRSALPAALLEHHPLRRRLEDGADDLHGLVEPPLGLVAVDLGRRRVLLHVHPLAVDVDDEVVLGEVGVVEAVAGDALALQPPGQPALVLAQPVGEVLGAAAERSARTGGRSAGSARLAGRPVLRARAWLARGRPHLRAGGARRGRAGGRRARLVVREHALQRAVPQLGLALRREADGLELPLVAGEHDGAPARERLPQALAELPVDGLGVRGVEPLAVGGVGGEEAALGGRRDRLQLGVVDHDQTVQPGALHEVARDLDGPLVPVRAADADARPGGREPLDAGAAALARLQRGAPPRARRRARSSAGSRRRALRRAWSPPRRAAGRGRRRPP